MNFISFVVLLFMLVFALLCISKLTELIVATLWVFKRGKMYRDELLEMVEISMARKGSKFKKKIQMSCIKGLDRKYPIQWPLVGKIILYLSQKSSKSLSIKIANIMIERVYRQPVLVCMLSVLLILFTNHIPNHILQTYCLGLLYAVMSIILLLIFSELLYFFYRRIVLGFADNFREDFEPRPIKYYQKAEYVWSTTDFVFKNISGVIIFLGSSIIGFYAIFCGLYQLDNQSFSFDVCPNKINHMIQLAYFSIVTIGTVGYGDIKPTAWLAQAAVSLEIIYGIGTLILLLFALSITLSAGGTD